MKLIIGEHEADILYTVGRIEPIEGAQRKIVEIVSEEPLPAEVLDALDEGFRTEEGGHGADYPAYKEVIRHSTWVAEVDPNAEVVIQKQAEIAMLNTEKEKLITETHTMKSAAQSVFRERKDDIFVQLIALMEEWDANGTYEVGDVCKQNNIPYTAVQATTPSGDLNQSPALAPALWVNYHAKSAKYALPYVAPTHAEDMYKQNEYMIFDEKIYKCLVNTDRDPTVLPNSWQEVDVNGEPVEPVVEEPGEGEEPQEPVEKNSNGTDVWSEWVVWNSDPATLYNIGDRVTLDGARYIATLDGNHWSPTSGTGWAVAPE